MNRGKPNWEHLDDDLHVLITCEDTPNRAEVKLDRAKEEIGKLLVPVVSTMKKLVEFLSSSVFSSPISHSCSSRSCSSHSCPSILESNRLMEMMI